MSLCIKFFRHPRLLTRFTFDPTASLFASNSIMFDKDLADERIGDRKKAARAIRKERRAARTRGGHVTAGKPSGIENRDWFERDVTRPYFARLKRTTNVLFTSYCPPITRGVEYRFYNRLPRINRGRDDERDAITNDSRIAVERQI